ncbi:hypothetical protein Sjap_002703 [Stephania japonica]|uniref:Uncharacterized protein n=1 Tax=Stephania japonica TaxID=461633 RepID=A0AAP0KNX1_9MAGN
MIWASYYTYLHHAYSILHAKYESMYEELELTQVDPNTPIDKIDLFYQVVGVNKGRVYRWSYGDSGYETPGASTSIEPKVR